MKEKKAESFVWNVVSYVAYITSLLICSIAASLLTVGTYAFYSTKFIFEDIDLLIVGWLTLVGCTLATPGWLFFLTWGLHEWRSARFRFSKYVMTGSAIAFANGICVAAILSDMPPDLDLVLFISAFFAVTGVVAAFFHGQIIRYWISPVVTSLRESAKKELYSQF